MALFRLCRCLGGPRLLGEADLCHRCGRYVGEPEYVAELQAQENLAILLAAVDRKREELREMGRLDDLVAELDEREGAALPSVA